MRMARWTRRLATWTAVTSFALASVACELAVGDTIPTFTCTPNVVGACPTGSTCDGLTGQCVATVDAEVTDDGASPPADLDATVGDASSGDERSSDDGNLVDSTVGSLPEAGGSDAERAEAATDSAVAEAGGDAGDAGPCVGLGCKCSGDSDCASGICATELTVSSALYTAANSESFCTQPCCSSSDCPAAGVCFATGAGGSYCVLPGWIDRSSPVGSAVGGAACTSNDDCRSGLCASQTCADTCCSVNQGSTECTNGAVCRIAAFPGIGFDTHQSPSCGAAVGCISGFPCGPCRNTADCSPGHGCEYTAASLGSKDIVSTCVTTGGLAGEGAACANNAGCASGICDPNSNECTDVCFANADCTKSGWTCRPEVVQVQSGGSYSVLYCGP
jgi:hypothetical protein